MRWRDPVDGHEFYEPPGGGIEPGETPSTAAQRELAEETGMKLPLAARTTLVRRRYWWKGAEFDHVEELFLATVNEITVRPQFPDAEEAASYITARWITDADIGTLDVPVDPRNLLELRNELALLNPGFLTSVSPDAVGPNSPREETPPTAETTSQPRPIPPV
jgi:8-oxo-dGTP pyrophosphatase MutT (NUDIX family)